MLLKEIVKSAHNAFPITQAYMPGTEKNRFEKKIMDSCTNLKITSFLLCE
jgi:hypothetical protein